MPLWVKPGSLATMNALDQLRKEPELDWSYLSPSAELKSGVRTGKFRLGRDQLLVDTSGHSTISVQDYAVAMIDELENPAHRQTTFYSGILNVNSHKNEGSRLKRRSGISSACDLQSYSRMEAALSLVPTGPPTLT